MVIDPAFLGAKLDASNRSLRRPGRRPDCCISRIARRTLPHAQLLPCRPRGGILGTTLSPDLRLRRKLWPRLKSARSCSPPGSTSGSSGLRSGPDRQDVSWKDSDGAPSAQQSSTSSYRHWWLLSRHVVKGASNTTALRTRDRLLSWIYLAHTSPSRSEVNVVAARPVAEASHSSSTPATDADKARAQTTRRSRKKTPRPGHRHPIQNAQDREATP